MCLNSSFVCSLSLFLSVPERAVHRIVIIWLRQAKKNKKKNKKKKKKKQKKKNKLHSSMYKTSICFAQIKIIMCMRKVLTRFLFPLFFFLLCIMVLWVDSEGPDQIAHAPASKRYRTHMGYKWVFIWVLYGQPIRDA